jgi:hypothetical protein
MEVNGLISIVGGIYGFLFASGYLPRDPKSSETLKPWRDKYGGVLKILFPILFLYGIAQVAIGLSQ